MIPFLEPVEHFGLRFDRGSILFEFDALREPERTQFPQIGHYLRARGVEFNEVPTPQMLWRGKLWPDIYIANQIGASTELFYFAEHVLPPEIPKAEWANNLPLELVSLWQHGAQFHDAFIEPMCRKISGEHTANIVAKFHRSIWTPIYHAQTLRARQSLPTAFYYPRAGYAGSVRSGIHRGEQPHTEPARTIPDADAPMEGVDIALAYCVAEPLANFSVCFVVDDSPIYRVTNQDVCAGTIKPLQRLIVEYRGECDVPAELERLGLAHVEQIAYGSTRLQLPTLANVAAGWTPRPHINNQLWSIINAET